ncbi:universal stress protein [Brevibacterium atlanticum]|uniref:universal stress protein n=1 Tax=Brevibacterium atlanticum TaxID=2697563 RepID=UPI001423D22F|nr:universal stress protein [Brevibacterium atlanticum]
MTDLYSTSQPRFPAPNLRVTASPGIDSAASTVVLAMRADASPAVLDEALAAARREAACVRAVVFGTDSTTAPSVSPLAQCTRLGESLAEAGVEFEVQRAGSDPAEQILTLAEDHRASLIVMSTKRRSPVVKLLLGSSAQQVILEAECPVLLVK